MHKYFWSLLAAFLFVGAGCIPDAGPLYDPEIASVSSELWGSGSIEPTLTNAEASIANPPCQIGTARWGVDDQAGQSNTQTPLKAWEASVRFQSLPTQKSFSLAHVPYVGMPHLKVFFLQLPLIGYSRTLAPELMFNNGNVAMSEEYVEGELRHQGTQVDALAHACPIPGGTKKLADAVCYGGHRLVDIANITHFVDGFDVFGQPALIPVLGTPEAGFSKLGIEHIKDYDTVGILLDVSRALFNGEPIPPGTVIDLPMILATMVHHGLKIDDINEGDVPVIRTGHEVLWALGEDGPYYDLALGSPGISVKVMRFFASRCVGAIAADNPNVEVGGFGISHPEHGNPGDVAPGHEYAISSGIPLMENFKVSGLADKIASRQNVAGIWKYEFGFAAQIGGGEGDTGTDFSPVATLLY